MMTGDAIPWDSVAGLPAVPPTSQIADPTPQSATSATFARDGRWMACDVTTPGLAPILDYLKTLPWRPDLTASNCEPGRY